jgi:pantoate--beta-alanine ligase
MIIVRTVAELRAHVRRWRGQSRRVGFAPTMGNLHAGHRRLMQVARELSDVTAASIFVNPLQFGRNEDLDSYPRTPVEDVSALEAEKVDLLFMPGVTDMYPRGLDAMTRVEVPALGDILCGASRPGHFRGVTTVVNRLLNLVQPDLAVFGKKDYQQLMLIRLMVDDLAMPIEIVGVDTVRERDGLALSSRNGYLTPEERARAPQLHATLVSARDALRSGATIDVTEQTAAGALAGAGFRVDYVSVRRQSDLGPPQTGDRALVVLGAASIGRTRLIDNLELVR